MSWPDLELDGDMARIASRLVYLLAARGELDVEIADLKAKLRSTINVGQRATIDGIPVLTVTPNRRFDVDMAKAKLPADVVSQCMTTTFDTRQAKLVLSPAVYDSCMRSSGEPIVRSL